MALHCPKCDAVVRGDAVDIAADRARCGICGAEFQVSGALARCPPAARVAAARVVFPPGGAPSAAAPPARIVSVEHLADGGIHVFLPARGLGKMAWSLFAFAVFWDAITAVLSISFIGGAVKGEQPWLIIFFFIPFWMVGVLVPLWGCWSAWGTTDIRLDPSGAVLTKRLFGRTLVRKVPLAEVGPFHRREAYKENDVPVYACTLTAGRSRKNFGHQLCGPDQEWLVGELNEALRRLKGTGS